MDGKTLQAQFPANVPVPAPLVALCDWAATCGGWFSGHFEMYEDSLGTVRKWFGHDAADDRIGLFGTGPDGSLFAVWQQDDGRCPVVFMDSEGFNNFVLSGNATDFLRLLAIGYGEIRFEDLSKPPRRPGAAPAFRQWVTDSFGVSIPLTGGEIVTPARAAHPDFDNWVNKLASRR